jgi:hypothetical protein
MNKDSLIAWRLWPEIWQTDRNVDEWIALFRKYPEALGEMIFFSEQ